MAELADAPGSKSGELTPHEGSTPSPGTHARTRFWSPDWKPTPIKSNIHGIDSLPDTMDITPAQFFGEAWDHRYVGEKALMFATLEQAVKDFQHLAHAENEKAQRKFAELLGWFDSADTQWPYSYQNICTELDINAGRIRKALSVWRQFHPEKPILLVRRKSHSKDASYGRKHP